MISTIKVDHLNVGVAQAYLNQKRLDQEAKNLNTNANNFNKQTQNWLTLIENFTSSLKVIQHSNETTMSVNDFISTGARWRRELG